MPSKLSSAPVRAGLVAVLLSTCLFLLATPARAQEEELTELSLEELMEVEVTSVSRAPEAKFRAPAAVHVISGEDLRRAGVTRLPEALRLVPGVQVARLNTNKWAISIRGFNDLFANKLLVLVDGRSVYTPLFSGVFWDSLDVLIEDVERIEVIRGPGATLWGANAVNGVINIITRHTTETQGAYARLGAGNEEHALAEVRYGGRLGPSATYRVSGKVLEGDEAVDAVGRSSADDWRIAQGGFRLDWTASENDDVMVTGRGFRHQAITTYDLPSLRPPFRSVSESDATPTGGHVLARWESRPSTTSRTTLTGSYTRTDRQDLVLGNERDTVEVSFQHNIRPRPTHEIVWGLGYRGTTDELESTPTISAEEEERTDHLFSGFLQDRVSLWDDRLTVIVGSKLEHNSYTDFEVQPGARLLWAPGPRHTVWGSVARAVRTPSRAERTLRIVLDAFPDPGSGLPVLLTTSGTDAFGAEKLTAYEAGYRFHASDWLSVDASGFFNRYDDLREVLLGEPRLLLSPSPHVLQPSRIVNGIEADARGFEVATDIRPLSDWRLDVAYSYLSISADRDDPAGLTDLEELERENPTHQLHLLSFLDLPANTELDTTLTWIDDLEPFGVPSYARLDLRFGWEMQPGIEIAVLGRNLLDDRHPEFEPGPIGERPTEVERSVAGFLVWRR